MTKHTPKELTVAGGLSLWGSTPWHSHVRLIDVRQHSPMNGVDSQHLATELARRWNAHTDLLEALIEVEQMIHAGELNEGTMAIVSAAIQKGRAS